MSSRSSGPAVRPVLVAHCLLLACVAVAVLCAATADAAMYKMVSCAGTNGIAPYSTYTNTTSPQNPGGIFEFHNRCGGQGGDPPGTAAHLRIVENQAAGSAGHEAVGWMAWSTPAFVHFKGAGAYTRQPNAFNEGWRSRFWIADFANQGIEVITQGAGLGIAGTQRPISSVFAPHLWPFGNYLDFHTFVWEMRCVRPAGCDRANYNATDLNGLVFVLSDDSNSQVGFTNTAADLLAGRWVRGTHSVTFNVADQGSGIRRERVTVDGAERWVWEHIGDCATSFSQTNGEWARAYQPCPVGGPWARAVPLDTATLADGAHALRACTQDYGQYQGLGGTWSETCDTRTIRVDNTAPSAPTGLHVTSANPQRYLDRFGAQFSLPPNAGSPIAKVHYNVVNAAGEVVKAARTLAATNPTALAEVEGPKAPGAYRLRVWLEDEVGHVGPAATAEIPRDTTPPAAPQAVSVAPPTAPHTDGGWDVRWQNIVDAGAPIDAAHYEVLGPAGSVLVATRTVSGENPQAIADLDAPAERGGATLRVWLRDAEGNLGAPATVPLAYRCPRSPDGSGLTLSAGLGAAGDAAEEVVTQDSGAIVRGRLTGPAGGIAGASVCVFSRILTDEASEFAGIAVTGADGRYGFAVPAGPSRELSAVYRRGHRELSATATLLSRVRPTLQVERARLRNKSHARFFGEIPGPHNDRVVVVLQVKQGKGWRAFRRYRTRGGGRYRLLYRFGRTTRPSTYLIRAQVRRQGGYPYLPGNSAPLRLQVIP